MDVSIIIVNYNTPEMTNNCINSIICQTSGLEYEIILIDNASTDRSREIFSENKKIKYYYSYENMGFGRANNVGMILSSGKYIFLLNSDTLLKNNAIKIFYDYAEINKQKAFYGAWLLDKSNAVTHSGASIPTIKTELRLALLPYLNRFPYIKNRKWLTNFNTDLPYSDLDLCETGYVTGADMFFSREILNECSWFDHNFFMYYEESDWQRRGKAFGIRSYLINGPKIVHLHDFSKSPSVKTELMQLKSNKYYHKKYNCFFTYHIYSIVLFLLRLFPIMFNNRYTLREKLSLLKCILR